ncbi:MAG: hypothetical protein QOI38_1085 [Sphingomonadales bacterium]|nr:hypothetical protein [Sphingomonadales bacterium]
MEGSEAGGPRRDDPVANLLEISRVLEETARIVRAHAETATPPLAEPPPEHPVKPKVDLRYVRALMAARYLRAEYLGLPPADHAFSMMLELYAARLEGRCVSQTALGAASGLPGATTVRMVHSLVEAGIFVRAPDPNRGRRKIIALSEDTADRLRAYLGAAIRMGGMLP